MPKRTFIPVYDVPQVKTDGYVLTVQPTDDTLVFERGAPIRFDVALTRNGAPLAEDGGELYACFRYNSEKIVWRHAVDLDQRGRGRIVFSSERSGFGNLHVYYRRGGKEILEQIRGLAISPERLERSFPCPGDFDAFWEERKRRAAGPLDVLYTRIDVSSHPELHDFSHKELTEKDTSGVEILDARAETVAGNLAGILTRPKGAGPGTLPALLFLHGAGVRPCRPGRFVEHAARGIMILELNAHGIPNDKPEAWYRDLGTKGALKDYHAIGRESRDTHYFVNMFLRVKRGLDLLTGREEWDGRTLVVMGGSQGAAQAYAGAYLEPRVSLVAGMIPAYGDLTGFLRGRTVDFPDWLALGPRGELDPALLDVAPYIDGVNFLRDYRRAAIFCFGLLDQGCLPTTQYVPVAECPADATVILQSDVYHTVCPAAEAMIWERIYGHAGLEQAAHACAEHRTRRNGGLKGAHSP